MEVLIASASVVRTHCHCHSDCDRVAGTSGEPATRALPAFSRGRGWLLQLMAALVCSGLVVACKVDTKPASGLVVQVQTDMAVPKDIDRIRVEASQNGTMLLSEDHQIGPGYLGLPAQFTVQNPGNALPVLIRAIGLSQQLPRIERSALIPIPNNGPELLHLTLGYLCDGTANADGTSTCGDGKTCKAGTCQDATASATDLSDDANSSTTSAVSAGDGGMANCFDTEVCFGAGVGKDVDLDPSTCSFAVGADSTSTPDKYNVALELPLGSAGVCDVSACWIVLSSGDEGWAASSTGRISVPPAVCLKQIMGASIKVAVSATCPTKSLATSSCPFGDAGTPIAVGTPGSGTNTPGSQIGDACTGAGKQSCGMCGTMGRTCENGAWTDFAACTAGGNCQKDTTQPCGTGGTQTCMGDCDWGLCLNQSCAGPSTRSCGMCGTQQRKCSNGVWADWGACSGEGICMPGTAQACAAGGSQACGGNCQWGDCGAGGCDGAPSEPCGNCGSHTRACDATTKQYTAFGACAGEGPCAPDSTVMCGTGGTQTCGGNCTLNASCTGQTCVGPSSQSCGNCGTQTRTCDMETATWSDWTDCGMQGECAPDALRTCGSNGLQVCDGDCHWDASCAGQTCVGSAIQTCGNCGVQARLCDGDTATWLPFSVCVGQGCKPGDTQACGSGGTQTCGTDCQFGACGNQTCPMPAPVVGCGDCNRGAIDQTCDATTGTWKAGSCKEPAEVCTVNATRTCANGGLETCGTDCSWGACAGQMCPAGSKPGTACENCGTQTVTCDMTTGTWKVTCTGTGVCAPNTTPAACTTASGASGTHTCSAQCAFSECVAQCSAPMPSLTCGNCNLGTRTVTCDPTTGTYTIGACTGDSGCAPNSSAACMAGTAPGTKTCNASCAYDSCVATPMQCPAPTPSTACGNCNLGMRSVTCDMTTGTYTIGACTGDSGCAPNTSAACTAANGPGTKTCNASCAYDACVATPMQCPAPTPSTACGNCNLGMRSVTCDMTTGAYTIGACTGDSGCAPNTSAVCTAANGTGMKTCNASCAYGDCVPTLMPCLTPAPTTSCGTCGTFAQTCNMTNGTWTQGACSEQPQPPPTSCGNCGTTVPACINGNWTAGMCTGEGVCKAGTTATCTTADASIGTVTCGSTCQPGECVPTL
jgi:hypothetical protein